jgi:hypothetical protein
VDALEPGEKLLWSARRRWLGTRYAITDRRVIVGARAYDRQRVRAAEARGRRLVVWLRGEPSVVTLAGVDDPASAAAMIAPAGSAPLAFGSARRQMVGFGILVLAALALGATFAALDHAEVRAALPRLPWIKPMDANDALLASALVAFFGVSSVCAWWMGRHAVVRLHDDRVAFGFSTEVLWAEEIAAFDDGASDGVRLLRRGAPIGTRRYRVPTLNEADRVAVLAWLDRRGIPRAS